MDLTFDRVTKLYGPVIGLNEFSCRIGPGITGLFGANGAGKSTLLKLASGQIRPTLGQVRIGNHSPWSTAAKWHFGYSPDLDSLYERLTGREFLQTMARLHGFSRREAADRTERVLAQVDMSERAETKLAGCSQGMRQRIKLGQALLHDPSVLLLDEPMTGIDPGGRRELTQIFADLARAGKTILLSSHILAEVESLAETIVMLARGRLVASGPLPEIRRLIQNQPLTVELQSPQARKLAARLLALPEICSVEVDGTRLRVRALGDTAIFAGVAEAVLNADVVVERMEILDSGAEAVFHYLDGGAP